MRTALDDIIGSAPIVNELTECKFVNNLFEENLHSEGIVIVSENIPVGLVMRSKFYQNIGTQYGYNVYMGRPIHLLMNPQPLIVENHYTISEISSLAMKRSQENLYDYIIVTENNRYKGIISIRDLLLKFSEVQVNTARELNPLTGLPGNHEIERNLKKLISAPSYSVLYIDLDNFKEYNDTYGFKKGDQLIQYTAKIINTCLTGSKIETYFYGHIGGDDFIVCLYDHAFHGLCQSMIRHFDEHLNDFYDQEHYKNGYILAEARNGELNQIPLVSLSIAVVTNQQAYFNNIEEIIQSASFLKKKCKAQSHSCYLSNSMEEV